MKRTLSLILSFILVFTSMVFICSPSDDVNAATTDELQQKIDELDKEIKENEDKLDALKADQKKQQEYLDGLEGQIKNVEDKATKIQVQISAIDTEIGNLDAEINQLKREIELTNQEITETELNIETSSTELAQRLRDAYMNGDESTLEIFMGSENLASFMTRLEYMKRVTENDKALIEDFKQQVVDLNKAKEKLEENKAAVDEKRTEQQKKRDDLAVKEAEYKKTLDNLEGQYAKIEDYLESLDKSSSVYQNYIKQLEKEKAAADAEIDAIYSAYYATSEKVTIGNADPTQGSSGSSGGSSGGGGNYNSNASWTWPLGSASCYISSYFGHRDLSWASSNHRGIDIAGGGIHGKPIYATRSGKVITASTGGTTYGIYTIIDHGDGYTSLYAHMSALYVSSGQYVQKGDMIGRVGSTGRSSGPHLHFEIRYYGTSKNPLDFVKKP